LLPKILLIRPGNISSCIVAGEGFEGYTVDLAEFFPADSFYIKLAWFQHTKEKTPTDQHLASQTLSPFVFPWLLLLVTKVTEEGLLGNRKKILQILIILIERSIITLSPRIGELVATGPLASPPTTWIGASTFHELAIFVKLPSPSLSDMLVSESSVAREI
jgi:hypothetical protein